MKNIFIKKIFVYCCYRRTNKVIIYSLDNFLTKKTNFLILFDFLKKFIIIGCKSAAR